MGVAEAGVQGRGAGGTGDRAVDGLDGKPARLLGARLQVGLVDLDDVGAGLERLVGALRWLAGLGIETVILSVNDVWNLEGLKVIGERVIPAVADLQPAAV